MVSAPAGWYPAGEGQLRYWDGKAWTKNVVNVAPDPSRPANSPTMAPTQRVESRLSGPRMGIADWLGWGGFAGVALHGLASSGLSGLCSFIGLYVLVVAVVALIRGHVHWARIRGRAAAGIAMGAAIGLFAIGGATASPTPDRPATERAAQPSPTSTTAQPTVSAPTPVSPSPPRAATSPVYKPSATTTKYRQFAEQYWDFVVKAKEHTGDYDDWLAPDKYTAKGDFPTLPKANDLRLGARLASVRKLNAKLDEIEEASDYPLPYKYKTTMDSAYSKLSPDRISADLNHDLTVLERKGRITFTKKGVQLDEAHSSTSADNTAVTVKSWVDGDTVDTSAGRVRLIGIDTPEMKDGCSAAKAAKKKAEAIAPAGTSILLSNPSSVPDKDKYGRLLRYVDVQYSDGTTGDVGYTQILASLAKARYDSKDGYDWHPREAAYQAASGKIKKTASFWKCTLAATALYAAQHESDEPNHLPAALKDRVRKVAKVSRSSFYEDRKSTWDNSRDDSDTGSSGDGDSNIPGWLCPTRWC